MKDISRVVSEDIFLSSYYILREYISSKPNGIEDINLILISEYLNNLTNNQIKKYYRRYILTGLVYSLPEFFASDLVTIPKGVSDIREYRFFSSFGIILYNSIGIFFAEMCGDMIENLNLQDRGIYSYAPTKYTNQNSKWKVNNKWKKEYDKYEDKLKEKTSDSDIVLSIDISHFFNSINHKFLIETINEFMSSHNRKKYSFDGNTEDILSYYFLSMMGDSKGLPQGKKNFASDYLAYLYLVKLDMEIENLVKSDHLTFVASVRYVDDTHFFFKKKDSISTPEVYKELSKVEHRISKWLYKNLSLSLNDKKTIRKIITNKKQKDDFIIKTHKKTSGGQNSVVSNNEVQDKVNLFINAVEQFVYPDAVEFTDGLIGGENRENLKLIFENSVKNKLGQTAEVAKMIKVLKSIDLELSAVQFNIFGALFEVANRQNKPYLPILIDYFNKNFDPKDKRHIHIMLIAGAVMSDPAVFKYLVKEHQRDLLKDDYGKYLLAYYFPNQKPEVRLGRYWLPSSRVYERVCLEKTGKFKNYPFINKNYNYPFKSILFLENTKELDSIYAALGGYVHEFLFRRWSVAFNKLQMVTHESTKYLFKEIKDANKGKEIVKILNKNGLDISTYEERDFLSFWERRNFNPVSHGSKNGVTAPEISFKELIEWEVKIIKLINKFFKLK